MEPAGERRDDHALGDDLAFAVRAAMEPAGERRRTRCASPRTGKAI